MVIVIITIMMTIVAVMMVILGIIISKIKIKMIFVIIFSMKIFKSNDDNGNKSNGVVVTAVGNLITGGRLGRI